MKLLERFRKKKQEPTIAPISICNFYTIWGRLGHPRREGHLIQAKMESGKTAVYRCSNVRHCMDPNDMFFLDYKFSHYKRDNENEYPVYC